MRWQCDAFARYFNALPSVKGLCAFGIGYWRRGSNFAFRPAPDRYGLYRCGNLWILGTFPAGDCLCNLSFFSHGVDGGDIACDSAVDRVNASRYFVARFFLWRQYCRCCLRVFVRGFLSAAPVRCGYGDLCGGRAQFSCGTCRIWVGTMG